MVNQSVGTAVHAIVNKRDAVFNGVGKLKDYQLKVHLNPDITPVAQPQRLPSISCSQRCGEKAQ